MKKFFRPSVMFSTVIPCLQILLLVFITFYSMHIYRHHGDSTRYVLQHFYLKCTNFPPPLDRRQRPLPPYSGHGASQGDSGISGSGRATAAGSDATYTKPNCNCDFSVVEISGFNHSIFIPR